MKKLDDADPAYFDRGTEVTRGENLLEKDRKADAAGARCTPISMGSSPRRNGRNIVFCV